MSLATFLLESPVAVGAIGLVVVTVGGVVYSQTRGRAALAATTVAVLLTIGAVIFERVWLTPSERVGAALTELFRAIEANDLAGVLAVIDASAAEVRADAETLMPRFAVERAGQGSEVRIDVVDDTATALFKPLIKARHKKTGAVGAYYNDLQIDFVQRGERWLVTEYRAGEDWPSQARRVER